MISLDLNTPQFPPDDRCDGSAGDAARPSPAAAAPSARQAGDDSRILRFYKSERMLHWALAIPFLVCFSTAIILVVVYNPDRTRPLRSVFSWLHRSSGVALAVLPALAALKLRGDARIHLYNIKQAWSWMFDDLKWLALMAGAAISDRVRLPEQGKFNAAEKLNFMVLMVTYPLYIATGVSIWVARYSVIAWLLHATMATLATPLLLGHLYMALIDPGGRRGLQGMISGFVDRQWAKHHYRRWYREHHEAPEEQPVRESAAAASAESESRAATAHTAQPAC